MSIEYMRDVLVQEANALEHFSMSLDEKYEKLVNMCGECQGKVILTGVGKSGHVARKISSTLASLGTASFFLHPSEAAHGDLGMVEKSDLVLFFSKSGETEELLQLLNSLKIIGCKMCAIVHRNGSSLQQYCDLTVVIPFEKEACINNLAPTTSTILAMALGDALAVQLSVDKGFKSGDFALFHPKGTLGKRLLLTVDMLASHNIEEISASRIDRVRDVLWKITKNHLGAISVVDSDGKLVGLVSDGDIRRGLEKDVKVLDLEVMELMSSKPISCEGEVLVVDAFKLMQMKKISVLPIIDGDHVLIGMVSFHDIVRAGVTN